MSNGSSISLVCNGVRRVAVKINRLVLYFVLILTMGFCVALIFKIMGLRASLYGGEPLYVFAVVIAGVLVSVLSGTALYDFIVRKLREGNRSE